MYLQDRRKFQNLEIQSRDVWREIRFDPLFLTF